MASSLTDEILEARLRTLTLRVPSTLVPGVLATAVEVGDRPAPRRTVLRRRIAIAALALAVFIGGNAVVARLIPAYASVLREIPIAGGILAGNGLTSSDITPANGAAVDRGYTVRVVGSYADEARTTILAVFGGAFVDGPALDSTTTLTDQFGTTYHLLRTLGFGGPQLSGSQDWSLNFEPLRGVALGARTQLTLHIRDMAIEQGSTNTLLAGMWQVHFSVKESAELRTTTPAPMEVAGDRYTFHAVDATAAEFELAWTHRGPESPWPTTLVSSLPPGTSGCVDTGGPIPTPPCPVVLPMMWVYAPDGALAQESIDVSYPSTPATSEEQVWFTTDGAGTYRIVITAPDGQTAQETFEVG
jgi:hypothetical protein